MTQDAGHTHSIESLLANEPWMRGLARTLLQDDAAAADAVQQAFTAALESPPSTPGAERGWLATVTRNFARQQQRGGANRRKRERAAAKPEALPDTAAIVEREELRRRVVEAVLELEEPYRNTVLWRFFEDLTPKEIGERTDTPAATVRTRLKRAMDHLRERLDGLHAGDRRTWAVALAPLARFEAKPLADPGASTVWPRVAWVAAAAVLVGAGAAPWWLPASSPAAQPVTEPQRERVAVEPADQPADARRGRPEAAADAVSAQDPAPGAAAAEPGDAPVAPPPPAAGIFLGRFDRAKRAARNGGGAETERAVDAGLRWLARHQSPTGAWRCRSFTAHLGNCDCGGPGKTDAWSPGTTALACLAFLGAGHAPGRGAHDTCVTRGIEHLLSLQQESGCIGSPEADARHMYSQAIAALALCEAAALATPTPEQPTRPRRYQLAAKRAILYLSAAQNPYLGWRYGVRQNENDVSVTAWAVQAMRIAHATGLPGCGDAYRGAIDGATNWVDKVTTDATHAVGYRHKGDATSTRPPGGTPFRPSESLTAAGLSIYRAEGRGPAGGLAKRVAAQPPAWNPRDGNDFYYWYWGSLALSQSGGARWKKWSAALNRALVPNQRRDGHADGSWDPSSAWGSAGGRVYATALNVLSLQSYYRYAPGAVPAAGASGLTIAGRVAVAGGAPAPRCEVVAYRTAGGARWRLAQAWTDASGRYRLTGLIESRVRVELRLLDHRRHHVSGRSAFDADAGATGVDFALALHPRVQLRVVGAEDRARLDGSTAGWTNSRHPSPTVEPSPDGVRVYLPPGEHRLRVDAPGRLATTVVVRASRHGDSEHPDPIVLEPDGELRGSVILPEGTDPRTVLLVLRRAGPRPPDGFTNVLLQPQRDGAFVATGLAPGRFQLHLFRDTGMALLAEAEVRGRTTLAPLAWPANAAGTAWRPAGSWAEQRHREFKVALTNTSGDAFVRALERIADVRLRGPGSEAKLRSMRISPNFSGTSLETILDFLSDLSGLEFDDATGRLTPPGD